MKEEALKLADELDTIKYQNGSNPFKPQADMIRKLVAELDKQGSSIWESFDKVHENCKCPSCKGKQLDKQGEPVAWCSEKALEILNKEKTDVRVSLLKTNVATIPLYTAPQTKPLSDEEIDKLATRKMNQILMELLMPDVGNDRKIDWNMGCTKQHLINFARAIEERILGK